MTNEPHQDLLDHEKAVEAFLVRLTGDHALAEDLTQETLIRAVRKAHTFQRKSALKSWLCAIALNLARDHFRAQRRKAETACGPETLERLSGGGEHGELTLMKAEMSRCIGEHLRMLPEMQYNVVVLYEMANLSHEDIAEAMGISAVHSRVLLHRGRAAFKEILKKSCVLNLGGDDVPCERRARKTGARNAES